MPAWLAHGDMASGMGSPEGGGVAGSGLGSSSTSPTPGSRAQWVLLVLVPGLTHAAASGPNWRRCQEGVPLMSRLAKCKGFPHHPPLEAWWHGASSQTPGPRNRVPSGARLCAGSPERVLHPQQSDSLLLGPRLLEVLACLGEPGIPHSPLSPWPPLLAVGLRWDPPTLSLLLSHSLPGSSTGSHLSLLAFLPETAFPFPPAPVQS